MIKEYSLKKDGETYLSKHFQVKEFRCKDGTDSILINSQLISVLECIRQHYNKPVIINSAYRTSTHNKKVGGSLSSQHILGNASDIKINGVPPKDIYKYADSILSNYGGIGLYNTFVHIDVRTNKKRWNLSE